MKIGDKVWTWNHWYDLIQIEIHTIEDIDKIDVVNGYILLDNISYTKEEARELLKVFLRKRIRVRKNDIKYLKEKLEGIQ